jgi:type II secretory pathway component GspD/PulD (secretin)
MTGWIVHQLDQPVPADLSVPQPAAGSAQQYLVAGKSDDVIRVFHLTTVIPSVPQEIQEILTTLRTVADIQKVFNYTVLADLVVRGPAAQIAFAEYLINSLDVKPGSATSSAEFQYQASNQGPQVARVFYLANASTPQAIQEMLTTLRTVADIQKIFCYTPLRALAIRGTATDIAASEWLIQSLDIPTPSKTATASTVREFQMPGNVKQSATVIRAFYPTYINTPQTLNETLTLLRTNLQVAKAFYNSKPAALIVRGSADQIAEADQLIQNSDQPSKSTP